MTGEEALRVLREGGSLQGADLRTAYFVEASLLGVNFRRANLERANFYRANLQGTNFRGANLERANFYGANLQGADLRWTKLRRAILEEADLQGAILEGAILEEADLQGANLHGADLHGADLHRAHLRGALLEGAIIAPEASPLEPKTQWERLLEGDPPATEDTRKQCLICEAAEPTTDNLLCAACLTSADQSLPHDAARTYLTVAQWAIQRYRWGLQQKAKK